MKAGAGQYSRIRLALNIYIAVVVTVLGGFVLHSVGINNSQNRKIAEQARHLANLNRKAALAGCKRGNFVRVKINTVSGALTDLLKKSIAENERRGVMLTPAQEKFLAELYEKLAPLARVHCTQVYGKR